MPGGRITYWECSCPKCGKPSHTHSRYALNKVGPPGTSKLAKCVICNTQLHEELKKKKAGLHQIPHELEKAYKKFK